MSNRVLLLTACITPGGMAYTALQNPKIREEQYLNALNWYLANTDFRIVLCENTNYQLPKKYEGFINAYRLEYLTFDGNNNFDKSRGKGIGEALIIQYAIQHSKFIAEADVIMKMTGRQILKNINFVSNHCTDDSCVYANLLKMNLGIMEAQSQFYICHKSFYTDCFFKGIDKLDDSRFYYFEHLLYDSIQMWKKNKKGSNSEFWMPLRIEGMSGSFGKPIPKSSFPWAKSLIKYLMHKMGIYKSFNNGIFTDQQVREFRGV